MHLTGDYWFKNVRCPVLFITNAINIMIEDRFNLFVEIGPHPLLLKGMCLLFEMKSYQRTSFSLMNRQFEDETNYYNYSLSKLVANNVDIKKLLKAKGNYILLPC